MTILSCDPTRSDRPGSDLLGGELPDSAASMVAPSEGAAAGPARLLGEQAPVAAGSVLQPSSRARRFALHFGLVLVAASGLGLALGGTPAGVSAALGVTLAAANLLLMQKITSAMTGGGSGAAWGLALPFKLVGLVGVAYALVATRVAQPVPLAMGFALLPLTGVFLPRPTSVPHLATPHPRRRLDASS